MHGKRFSHLCNILMTCGALAALALAPSGSLHAQIDTPVDLDQTPGNESVVRTQVLNANPVRVENVIFNNSTGREFTFSWPGAGPGGFSAFVAPGPSVGTRWFWETQEQVFTVFDTPITFRSGVEVVGTRPEGISLGSDDEMTFSVFGKSINPGNNITIAAAQLDASVINFFSPPVELVACSSSFTAGVSEQTITNFTEETVTVEQEQTACCDEPQQVFCEGECFPYLTDPDHCGGCEIQCAGDEFCDQGTCESICPVGLTLCGEECVDLSSDLLNCGGCGDACDVDPPMEGVLYAVDGASGNAASLHILDPATGALIRTVGPTGFDHVTGLAFHPVTDVLYAVVSDLFGSGDTQLITIDPVTGSGSLVATTGHQFPDIAFDSTGTLYGWSVVTIQEDVVETADLYTIDLTTGTASKVGECGDCPDGGIGLAFDSTDTLYMKSRDGAQEDEIHEIDPATGTILSTVALDFNNAADNLLAFDPADVLFTGKRGGGERGGEERGGEEGGGGLFTLLTLDPGIGTVTTVGSNDLRFTSAIAFGPEFSPVSCFQGACSDCPEGLAPCGDDCVDTSSDLFNCGACDNVCSPALDGVLYSVDGASGNAASLHILDPFTGAVVQTVGPTGFNHVTGLGFDPVTGVLYGVVSGLYFDGTTGLITIDPSTGSGSLVGSTGHQLPDITFNSVGTLYAWSAASEFGSTNDLYTIDLTTGAATLVGECGSCFGGGVGLAFDSSDKLYRKERFEIGELVASTGTIVEESTVSTSESTDNLLAFDPSDVLYTGKRSGSNFTLMTLDPATGVLTTIGSNDLDDTSAIAFGPGPSGSCLDGVCVDCPEGLTACGGECKDLDTDADNCGSCFNQCGPFETCLNGGCCPAETVTVPFFANNTSCPQNGSESVETIDFYSGNVRIDVSGFGNAAGATLNDAFYLFNASGSLGYNGSFYHLQIDATNPLSQLGSLPAYNPSHEYSFEWNVATPRQLSFRVSDCIYTDNGGSYTVTVTPLDTCVDGAPAAAAEPRRGRPDRGPPRGFDRRDLSARTRTSARISAPGQSPVARGGGEPNPIEAPICTEPPSEPVTILTGESVTTCVEGARAGREVIETVAIVINGEVISGPCARIVPDPTVDTSVFLPAAVEVLIGDETGDALCSPGERCTAFVPTANLGDLGLDPSTATLSSPLDEYNDRPVEFHVNTSDYPAFLPFSTSGNCGAPPQLDTVLNDTAFEFTVDPLQEGSIGRVFVMEFDDGVNPPTEMRFVVGIGSGCNPGTDIDGLTYDGVDGFLQLDSTLVPAGDPVVFPANPLSDAIVPLDVLLSCGPLALAGDDIETAPTIVALEHVDFGPVAVDDLNVGGLNPDHPAFTCPATGGPCSYDAATALLIPGRHVITVRMPDLRRFQAGFEYLPARAQPGSTSAKKK